MKVNYIPDVMSEWDCHVLDMMKRRRLQQKLLKQYHEHCNDRKNEQVNPFKNYTSGISW